ncbi:hypothetical protein Lalb_Chr16g0377781 [Lupinus albus]|uniref:Uncharacterized protein n=1 Tax=Lupinus albus TaxID=3870 RepID=A0A6A4P535_LUPAL|nr:hypothetical protein Lalb_Chr16g0377781 [Lupinus albus]
MQIMLLLASSSTYLFHASFFVSSVLFTLWYTVTLATIKGECLTSQLYHLTLTFNSPPYDFLFFFCSCMIQFFV